nr:hypothetical protein [Candidatus Sigynarchaeota archaeon]
MAGILSMANLGRKKLYIDVGTNPDGFTFLESLKKKIKISMIVKMSSPGKLEIDLRGSKEDIQHAIIKIKDFMRQDLKSA